MADQSNSGRNALIIGTLLGLITGGLGVYTMLNGKASIPVTELDATGTKAATLTAKAEQAKAEKERSRRIVDIAPEGAMVNNKPRFTPIFFSPELWQVSLDVQKKNTVIDIYDPKAESLHNGIPNSWFISNNIADALGRADGPELDSDGDGFSNREEFAAKTSPSDAASLPSLVESGKAPKLEVVRIIDEKAYVVVDSMLAFDQNPTETGINIFANANETKALGKKIKVKPGDSFGLVGPKADPKRFTVLGFEKATYEDSVGGKSEEYALKVRDNATISGAKEFTIRAGRTRAKDRDFGTINAKGRLINDLAAEIRVTAGAAAGKPEGTVIVPLRGEFTVPGTKDLTCTLESIDAAGTVNILPKGSESPVQVPKAGK